QYISLYAGPLTALIWTRAIRVQPPQRRGALLLHTLAALGVFFLLCGWRLSTLFLVLLEDKRERVTWWDQSISSILDALLSRPSPDWPSTLSAVGGAMFGDLTCYIGPVVLGLFLMSLALGWRWWHALTLTWFWLALGSERWYPPSYWLADWPFFGSAHVVTRWRYLALLGVGMGAGSVLARGRAAPRPGLRALAMCLVGIIAGDFLVLGYQQLPRAFSQPPEPALFPGPPVPDIVNVRDGLGYPCTLRAYALIRGYQP